MRHLLAKHSDIISTNDQGNFRHHVRAKELKQTFHENHWDWDNYFKFTVVRNPISRLYSIYKYRIRLGSNPPSDYIKKYSMGFYLTCVKFTELKISFNDAVLHDEIDIPTQASWILNSDKTSLLDNILKIENINSQLPSVWSRLGLPLSDLESIPDLNRSPSEVNWDSLLSEKAINKIKTKYHEDFNLLDY